MKKIFVILISLIFVASVFGVAQTMALPTPPSSPDCCDSENFNISRTSVRVGETFTVSVTYGCFFCLEGVGFESPCDVQTTWSTLITGPPQFPFPVGSPIEVIGVQDLGQNKYIVTLKAVSPGTLVFKNTQCCNEETTVKIFPRALPMLKFMKILGLGNTD
ncbi:MAG: hypothetical protein HPY60_02995 [Candidatus Methanofastidiosum sp.]|nr:hypothetical protein [Methanofastidiosum sp.]